jgi:hypothetical protein
MGAYPDFACHILGLPAGFDLLDRGGHLRLGVLLLDIVPHVPVERILVLT